MKYLILFFGKSTKNISSLSSAEFAYSMLSVKDLKRSVSIECLDVYVDTELLLGTVTKFYSLLIPDSSAILTSQYREIKPTDLDNFHMTGKYTVL